MKEFSALITIALFIASSYEVIWILNEWGFFDYLIPILVIVFVILLVITIIVVILVKPWKDDIK